MLMTWRLARFAPGLVRGWLGLVARGIQSGGTFWIDRVAASFPEPDRSLFRHSEYRDYFTALLCEAFRAGTRGPVWDIGLLARPWGIDLASINVPVLLWHGERDGNVSLGRYLASAIPNCRSTFYPDEGHLSITLNRHREILAALTG